MFQIDLAFLDVRLFTGVSINIFLVFIFFVFFYFVFNIVTWLNVGEFNQMVLQCLRISSKCFWKVNLESKVIPKNFT